jgi:acyl carrier protein
VQTAEQIRAELKQLIADQQNCEAAEIPDGACLSGELGLDSLDIIYLMINIEDRLTTRIPEKEFRKIRTLDEAVMMIQRLDSGARYGPRIAKH